MHLVTGTVRDTAGSPVPGVWVYLTDQQGNAILDPDGNQYKTKTHQDGTFRFDCVPHRAITVTVDPVQPGGQGVSQTVTVPPSGVNVVLTVQSTSATVIVHVVDADNNNNPLSDANVHLVRIDGSSTQYVATQGNPPVATFLGVAPAGLGSAHATKSGYVPNSVPALFPAGGSLDVTVPLHLDTSTQSPTAFVMQLDWGLVPRDLDLHCSGPDGVGGRFHCLFNAMQPVPFVRLDVDDTTSTGPERITVSQVTGAFIPGDYHCWIYNYSGEQPLSVSGASLSLTSLDEAGYLHFWGVGSLKMFQGTLTACGQWCNSP